MATLNESTQQSGGNDKAAGLIAAIGLISGEQNYTFELYKRVVLPIDGFVFWVKAQNIRRKKVQGWEVPFELLTPLEQDYYKFESKGSFHLSQNLAQETDSTYVAQTIYFTTKNKIEAFENIAPTSLYVLTLPNGTRIAFNSQMMRYELAGLWHYRGKAIYSTQATQLIDDPAQLDYCNKIVSNSLPIWLAMSEQCAPIYPAYLLPLNLKPPYVTVEVTNTSALGQAPLVSPTGTRTQLVMDTIKFTSYGLRNDQILDFQNMVLQNSLYGDYGIMNMPVPVDDHKTQVEFQIIAQKKTMLLQINYYQERARQIAQKYIESAFITLTPIN